MFTFTDHMPFDPREIARLVGESKKITITKFVYPQPLYNLFDAVRDITYLDVKNFTALRARENFVPYPPRKSLEELVELILHVSFQQNVPNQLKLIRELISKAPSLSRLSLTFTQFPTDVFLKTEPYALRHDPGFNTALTSQVMGLPSMLQLPTPRERETLELEADGKQYGTYYFQLLTGILRPREPMHSLEAELVRMLPAASPELAASSLLALQPQAQQQLLPSEVQTEAAMGLMEMHKKPKYTYMSKAEWDDMISGVLGHPFAPSLQVLELQALFPPTPIRFLSGLVNLEKLKLHFCGIDAEILKRLEPSFEELYSLRILDLERNELAGADLAPLAKMPSLEKLLLQNNGVDGPATTSLLRELSQGENSTLRFVDLAYNPIRTPGLSFDNLDRWAAPDATLVLPNLFSPKEAEKISACMPDGSTLEFVGEYHDTAQEEDAPLMGMLEDA